MKRSTGAIIALLAFLTAAVFFVAWQMYDARRSAISPTPEPPAVVEATTTVTPTASPSPSPTVDATPTAVLDANLTAALDPALDLDDHPPAAPITLTFDRPIDIDPELRPMAINPSVAGVFRWNDDATAVTFTPSAHFQPRTRYRLTADAALRGADGATFDEPPAWSLTAAEPPRVQSRVPSATAGADRQPAITLTFTRDMDRESVEAALSVEPPVPLDLGWDGDKKLTLRPTELLDPGVAHDFVLSTDAADRNGVGLIGVYGFRYTPSPVITRVEGPTRANPDAPFLIRFGYPMDWDATVPALFIEPPIDAEIHRLDERTLELIDPPLLGNAEYQFTFSAEVNDAEGNPLPAPAAPAVYTSPSPVLAFFPTGNDVPPASVLRVDFDRPVDPATTADALSILPRISGAITWANEHALLFTPEDGAWQPDTAYEIAVGTGATDADGRPILGQPATHRFATGEERHLADWGIGPQTQVLDADGRRAVQFQANVKQPLTLNFDLLPLDQTGFLNRIVGDVTSGWFEAADPIADDGLSPVASWTGQTTPGHPDLWGNPQETLIPADAPPGLYLLRLNGPTPANLLLALSRMTLVAKLSDGKMVVWVTDIDSRGASDVDIIQATSNEGGPTLNATVQVYAQNGRLLAEGTTDERGIARLALPPDAEPYVVFAQSGGDTTFSALTPEMQARGEYYVWWGDEPTSLAPPAFAVHVQTDRPIYRPGQTVHYKVILRLDDDGAVSLPPAGTQAIVRLRDSRDNVVITRFLATDEFGAVHDSFDVAEGAMLGEYAIEVEPVRPGGGSDAPTRQTFQVEEYRKPDFSVTVDAGAPEVLAGDILTVTIAADYLFGEPVAGADVDIKTWRVWNYGWWGAEDIWEEDPSVVMSGSTDVRGRLVLSVPVGERPLESGYWGFNPSSWRLAIEATVNDGSNQTVSTSAVVTVHRTAESIGLTTPGYFVEFGGVVPFTATVTTTLGDPLPVEGRTIRGTLRVWSHETFDYTTIAAEHAWTTGSDGAISAYMTPPEPGHYQLRLVGEDENGRVYHDERYLYVLGKGERDFWSDRRQTGLSVSADRESYAPGDTATLLITTDFAGPALLTFERAAVRREMPVMLTPPVTAIEVPILSEDVPNIFVTVNAWEPLTTVMPNFFDEPWLGFDSQRDAELRTATVELSVPVTDRTLTVTIETDQDVYAPRDEATVTVRVADAAGQPVRAQVALAMVDEAIFLLAHDNTRPLHDAFYGPRVRRVLTRDAMAPGRYLSQSGGMGGGGGDGMGAPRSDFPDTAAWFPALVTDANGEATVTVALADSLTMWRLTARAVTAADTSVGEAVHKFTTHQDVIIRPILPGGLTVGDEIVLSAVVHNYGDEPVELAVSLSDEAGLLAFTDPMAQTVALEPGATRVVGWPAEVIAGGETAALAVAAIIDDSGEVTDAGDAVELPLVVRELAVPVYEYATGNVEGSGEIELNRIDEALPTSEVTLEVSRSPAGTLLNGLEYLIGFPYGCVEQTMSRALPNAVVSRAFSRLGIPAPVELDLDRLVNESAQKLYGFQHEEGGWGWWFDDDGDSYQTAWVLFGLATMAEAGHEIDPGVIERGAAFLRERLDKADPRTRAYMLYSLAVAGELDEVGAAAAPALLDEVENGINPRLLDPFSLAALALALDAAGEDDAAQTAMDHLAALVEIDGDIAFWGEGGDGQYNRKVMASSVRSTALALSAFVRLRPGDDLEPLIVNYLMERRRGSGWGTTNETAHAVIALTDHLLGAGLGQTTAAYDVTLNGEPLTTRTIDEGELRDVIDIPLDRLQPGANTVTLTAADGGRLYYTLNERYQAARETIEAGGSVSVHRTYLSPDDGKQLESIAAGDLVLVRVTVRFPQGTRFVVVEDQVPAGLEPLNERLNTTVHDADFFGVRAYSWHDLGYNYKEIRDGRVSFFVTSIEGFSTQYEYLARATHSGTFTALPAEAWAMYELDVWGRSASDEVRIEN